MDPETGFSDLSDKEKQHILSYSDVEILFLAKKNFYRNAKNAFFRKHAVLMISMLAKRIDNDTFIPYLAMNYFDRFFSKRSNILEDVEGYIDTVKVRLIAIACLTIAAKMRIKDFSIEHFLVTYYRIVNVRISHNMVMRTELLILHELDWEMIAVTPFTFLNFYYRYFKSFGGFKRRCINEIIVQAQGAGTFVEYFPTVITISAFLAASLIAYPDLYGQIIIPFQTTKVLPRLLQYKVIDCVEQMVDLCTRLNIQIETPKSGTTSTSELKESQQDKESGIPSTSELKESQQDKESGIPSTSELKESQQDKGKGVMVDEEEDDDQEEGTPLRNLYLEMSKMMKESQALKISERVEGETSGGGDEARVERMIRESLEKGKAVEGEKMKGYVSQLAALEELKSLMNFELKWPEEVPSTPEPQTAKSKRGKILRTAKKLARGGCKIC